jgi:hypothetical protein
MVEEFDLLMDVPAFPAYALPPDAFPGFSAGSYGGGARSAAPSHTSSTYTGPTTRFGVEWLVSQVLVPQTGTSFFAKTRCGAPALGCGSARSSPGTSP